MLLSSKDRHDLYPLYEISGIRSIPDSSSAMSPYLRPENVWTKEATVIPTPGTGGRDANRKVRPSMPSAASNPFSRMKNDIHHRSNPSSNSLVPVTPSQTMPMRSNKPPASKKRKLNGEDNAIGKGSFDNISYTPSGKRTDASENALRKSRTIPIFEFEEDIGEPCVLPASESSDDLRLRDGERPGQDQDKSTIIQDILQSAPPSPDHPFHTKDGRKNHQPPPSGPQKSAVKRGNNSSSWPEADAIESFDDPPANAVQQKGKGTSLGMTGIKEGHVRGLTKQYEGKTDVNLSIPKVDLAKIPRKPVIASMKPKNQLIKDLVSSEPSHSPRLDKQQVDMRANSKSTDPIATSSTGFRSDNKRVSKQDYLLPIEKWILGTHAICLSQNNTTTQRWLSVKDKRVSVVDLSQEGAKRTELDLVLNSDIKEIVFPRDETDDFPSLVFKTQRTDKLEHLLGEHAQGGQEVEIHLKFDKEHRNWDTKVYQGLLGTVRSCGCTASYEDSPARRSRWGKLEADVTALPQPSRRPPKPRPAYAGTPGSSNPLTGENSSSLDTPRRSARISSNTSLNLNRQPSPPNDETILLYPPAGTGAVNVTNSDLKRLEPGEYLNDTLIELGLKLWLNNFKNSNPELAEMVHIFSSFFYTQLNQKNIEEGYQSVRKWTSRFDLFRKRYVIVPINEHMHWYLAIICYPERILETPTLARPVSPNVPTRKTPRETQSKPRNTKGQERSKAALATGTAKVFNKYTAVDEQEVEMIVSSNGGQSNQASPLSPLSPLSTLSTLEPDSPREVITDSKVDHDHDKHEHSIARLKGRVVVSPSLSASPPHRGTVPASSFYACDDVQMRNASEEKEGVPAEADQLDDDTPMDVDSPPPLQELAKLDREAYIFSFDSLGARHPHALTLLARYLDLEAKDKRHLPQTSPAIKKHASVPTQNNYCDCGVYLLHFVEQFMADPEYFTQCIAEGKSRKSGDVKRRERELRWNHAEVASKRENLKQTILSLSSEWKRGKEGDSKGKGKAEDESKQDNIETIAIDNDSDIEVLEISPELSRASKIARTPNRHKAERFR